jgi:hypothetical protein
MNSEFKTRVRWNPLQSSQLVSLRNQTFDSDRTFSVFGMIVLFHICAGKCATTRKGATPIASETCPTMDVIQARLCPKLSPRNARAVCRRLSQFPSPSRNAQVFALASIIPDEFQANWSLREIGLIFDINKGNVHRIRAQGILNYEACIGHLAFFTSHHIISHHITPRGSND